MMSWKLIQLPAGLPSHGCVCNLLAAWPALLSVMLPGNDVQSPRPRTGPEGEIKCPGCAPGHGAHGLKLVYALLLTAINSIKRQQQNVPKVL